MQGVVADVWAVWRLTGNRQIRHGMDAVLQGRDLAQVERVAEALAVVIDQDFLRYWMVLEAAEMIQETRARKRAARK